MIAAGSLRRHMWVLVVIVSIGMAFLASGCLFGVARSAATGRRLKLVDVTYVDSNGQTRSTKTGSASGIYAFVGPDEPAEGPAFFSVASPEEFEPVEEWHNIKYTQVGSLRLAIVDFSLLPVPHEILLPEPQADLALAKVFVHPPPPNTQSRVHVQIQNNGPDDVTNVQVTSECRPCFSTGSCGSSVTRTTHSVTLAKGAKADFATDLVIDTTAAGVSAQCSIAVPLSGDAPGNNDGCWGACGTPSGGGPATADLELARVFVHPPPPNTQSRVHVEIQNNGPDNLTNLEVKSECKLCFSTGSCAGSVTRTTHNVTLAKGAKAAFATDLVIDTTVAGVSAQCSISASVNGDAAGNNSNCWGACGPSTPSGPPTADLALVQAFVHPPPPNQYSKVHVQIHNNGPDDVTNIQVTSVCDPCVSAAGLTSCFPVQKKTTHKVTLAKGATAGFATDLVIDTTVTGSAGARCTITIPPTSLNGDLFGNNRGCWGSGCPW